LWSVIDSDHIILWITRDEPAEQADESCIFFLFAACQKSLENRAFF